MNLLETITDAQIVLPDRCISGDLVIGGGKIIEMRLAGHGLPVRQNAFSARGCYVIPGLIDLHMQGFAGIDLSTPNGNVARMARALLAAGATGYVATLGYTPDTLTEILPHVYADNGGARMLGIYFEGPFINERRLGAIPPIYCLKPNPSLLRDIIDEAAGCLKIMTVAPELDGAVKLIEMLGECGAAPALGHTACSYSQAMRGIDAGIRHVTHLFNAMTPLSHREPGAVGAALAARNVTVELIADGVHIHPAVLAIAINIKGPASTVVITDATPYAGLQASGPLTLLGKEVIVIDGAPRLADGTLAGSILTPIQALKNLVRLAGVPLHAAVRMLTLTPATVIGLEHAKGSIAPGKDADLAILDENLDVQAVVLSGRLAWQR